MEPARHLDVVNERGHSLLATAATGLDRPVPSCPDWNVVDLVGHIGSAWGWAADTVKTGSRSTYPLPPDGAAPDRVLAWAHTQLTAICEALAAVTDPDADCWTFGLPRNRRFWFRRQALESTLHGYDVEAAVGTPAPIDPEVARDGIDEFLTVLVPRFVAHDPGLWAGETFHFHRTDGDGEWLVRLGPNGEVDAQRTHAKGDVAIRGAADALWLWITGRRPDATVDALEVLGDGSLAERLAATISF